MSVYVIEEIEKDERSTELAPIVYRTFDQAKKYLKDKADVKRWKIVNEYGELDPDFEEDNVNMYTAGRVRTVERPVGKTYIWAQSDYQEIHIIIYKLTLEDDAEDPVQLEEGGRRKTRRSKTIRMKKSKYLRVLRNPTRRALK